ncbi:MAG: SDR family NAD(P)-dependent oxidoreductase [Candidatus Roizmanbacteria bacterium]
MGSTQSVLITGASSGLGFVLAQKYIEKGATVYGIGAHIETLDKASKNLSSSLFHPIMCDISNPVEVAKAVAMVPTVDILVNNAGKICRKPLVDISDELIRDLVNANLLGHLYVTKYALPKLLMSSDGHIVNISSNAGLLARKNHVLYAATKFGIRGMGEALVDELSGTNVHVLNVYPGGFVSELYKKAGDPQVLDGFMDPSDLADQIMYALSAPKTMRVEQIVMNRKK